MRPRSAPGHRDPRPRRDLRARLAACAPRRGERGQGLVEFTMIVPVVLLVVVSVAELGLVYGDLITVGYGSREGARVGSALANGDVSGCGEGADPAGVDAAIVSAVQRILKSPGSSIHIDEVQQIRIFKATSDGAETQGQTNIWTYAGVGGGPEVDPGPGVTKIDFSPSSEPWPACTRVNNGSDPDSIGVTVTYRYRFLTPFGSMLDAITGGAASVTVSETTVMALNPSV